jgi:recombination protein RecA
VARGRSKSQEAGKVHNMGDMIKRLNKKYGMRVAHDLNEENPTEVKEWIPTGSRWLDSVICKGQMAGIPVGKITEVAGLSATGKSYLAVNIAANAQKMGHYVVYFDAESAIDPEFIRKAGVDTSPEKFMYIQAVTVEQVLEMMEDFIGTEQQTLFIWDSIANTPTEADKEGDFNPNSSVGKKARTLSLAFQKLTIPIANSQCTLLGLNQLKTVIASTHAQRMEALSEPYTTPGGKSMVYNASLRIWLTGRKAKSAFVKDENGFTIGSEVKATLKKSRFGTERRQCTFQIMWGADEVRILDEESWFEAIKGSEHVQQAGAWYSLVYEDGTTEKFQATRWMEKLEDPKFKNRVLELMDIEVIGKYRDRQGSIESFEDIDAAVAEG